MRYQEKKIKIISKLFQTVFVAVYVFFLKGLDFLRHTFAVHALEKMDREGCDLYYALPILSTYLGHGSIRSTEKYLRLTFETRDSITDSMSGIYHDIFPEV